MKLMITNGSCNETKLISVITQPLKQIKMLIVSTEIDDHCLLTTRAVHFIMCP